MSIVVPTRNRRQRIIQLLTALSEQTAPPDRFEVLIADDGSTDGTAAAVSAMSVPYALRLLELTHGGAARARNAATSQARGITTLYLDDDVAPVRELVERHLEVQRASGGVIAVGRIELRSDPRSDWYARRVEERWRQHYDRLESRSKNPTWTDCYGGNLSVPTRRVLEAGGWDPEHPVIQDVELGFRLVASGLEIVYLPGASVEHDDMKPARRQVAETFAQGAAWVAFARAHPVTRRTLLRDFRAGSPREAALRRMLICLRVPVPWLTRLQPLARVAGVEHLWWEHVDRVAYWAGVRSAVDDAMWRRLTRRVPILMYHGFADRVAERTRYIVSARQLRAHVRWLRLLRRHVVSLEDLVVDLARGEPPPERAVVLTVDDGYTDVLRVAAPILHRARMPFTVFVVSGRVGQMNDWDESAPLRGRPIMDAEQLREVERMGASIGAHGRSHVDLRAIPPEEMSDEVAGSRIELGGILGREPLVFAYPYGGNDAGTRATVEEVYRAAVTTHEGGNDLLTPLSLLRRNEVRGTGRWPAFVKAVLFTRSDPRSG